MLRGNTKCLLEESMTSHYINYKLLIRGTRLVTGSPPAIHEFQLPFVHQHPHILPRGLILHVPPALEVVDLGPGELAVLPLAQLVHDAGQDEAHLRVKVVLRGLQPAHVIVRVGDEVDVEQLRVWQLREHVLWLLFLIFSG